MNRRTIRNAAKAAVHGSFLVPDTQACPDLRAADEPAPQYTRSAAREPALDDWRRPDVERIAFLKEPDHSLQIALVATVPALARSGLEVGCSLPSRTSRPNQQRDHVGVAVTDDR